jgi:hypothetical protein
LKPTSWSPAFEGDGEQFRVGATVFGSDVLGYHFYDATATWLVASPAGSVSPATGTPDWHAAYVYNRWRPALFASASLETSFFTGLDTVTGQSFPVTLRERLYQAGVQLPIVHVRRRAVGQFSFVRTTDDYTADARQASLGRVAARAAGAYMSSHRYAASISQEDGVAAGVTAEVTRDTEGADSEATRLTGEIRAYLKGGGPHRVIALRGVGATTSGRPSILDVFRMGGSPPDAGLIDFSTALTTLMRGFPNDTFAGRHAALVNIEYRAPLARPQRGAGTWPLFMQALHAAGFADVGQVWTTSFRASDTKASFGAELSADTVLGFYLPITASIGAAWGHDGSGNVPDHTRFYLRLGNTF